MEPFNILNKDMPQSRVLLSKPDTLELGSLRERVFRDGSSILMIFTQVLCLKFLKATSCHDVSNGAHEKYE